MKRGSEDQSCREKLVLPQGLKKWILKLIDTCLPIHVVVSVSLKDSSWIQIVSKSNIAKLKSFVDLCT